jgi:hypothetical protein
MTNTIAFAIFPFTHKGYQFISKVAETSRYLPQIISIKDEFIKMNTDAIDELIPTLGSASLVEIQAVIDHINEGGTEMFLELVGEDVIGGND